MSSIEEKNKIEIIVAKELSLYKTPREYHDQKMLWEKIYEELKVIGFLKKNRNTLIRKKEQVTQYINIQRSQYGSDVYYLNVCFSINDLCDTCVEKAAYNEQYIGRIETCGRSIEQILKCIYEFIKDTDNLDKTNTLQFLGRTSSYYGGVMMNKYAEKLKQLNANY